MVFAKMIPSVELKRHRLIQRGVRRGIGGKRAGKAAAGAAVWCANSGGRRAVYLQKAITGVLPGRGRAAESIFFRVHSIREGHSMAVPVTSQKIQALRERIDNLRRYL